MFTSMVGYTLFKLCQRIFHPIQAFILFLYEYFLVNHKTERIVDDCSGEDGIKIERWNSKLTLEPFRKKRQVVFSNLEIRTYESILGDNPSVSKGPPLGIGWTHYPERTEVYTVDAFEKKHARASRPQLHEVDLLMERHEREAVLLHLGYTKAEIAAATRQCIKAKKKRRQTVDNLKVAFWEETLEGMSKTARRTLLNQHGTKFLYEQWKKNGYEISDQLEPGRKSSLVLSREDSSSGSEGSSNEGRYRGAYHSAPTRSGLFWRKPPLDDRRKSV